MLGGENTHLWSATKVGNPILATIPVAKRNNQQTTHTSHYRSRPVEFFKSCNDIEVLKKLANSRWVGKFVIFSTNSLSLFYKLTSTNLFSTNLLSVVRPITAIWFSYRGRSDY